jgi:alpha-ketoglutarate-dependent taurine dioxygenase
LQEHQLVLLRGVHLDAEGLRRLGQLLGPLRPVPRGMQIVPGLPDVQCLGNLDAGGHPTGRNPDPDSLRWHSDGSATRIPARYTLLYGHRIPRAGGETVFADMYAACAALSPAERRELIGRRAVHDPEVARWIRGGAHSAPANGKLRRVVSRLRLFARLLVSPTRHPVIRVHEETGKECLFLGDHAWRIIGLRWRDGVRRVNELNDFVTAHPEWTYTHSWQAGDLLVWDNRCLLHRGTEYDVSHDARVMLRAVVVGEKLPVAART